ncbi:MAG: hypothetical protein IID05_10410, partial [Gemmatimonadetes bacterium]|nr:hypothetical protein [Gemmatimonadota bacterium]
MATVLDDVERSRLDAAAGEYVSAVHTKDMDEAIRAVREQPINAVLVSPSYVSRRDLMGVARLVREFPGVPTIAIVSRPDAQSSERLLELGKSGVQSLVDLSRKDGWRRLRSVVGQNGAATASRILAAVWPALAGAAEGTVRFFETLVIVAPRTPTAKSLTTHLAVRPSTFTSRFFR